MHPTLSWSDLAGRAVAVYGLGREGQASIARCVELGVDPVLVDDVERPEGFLGRPVLATGAGGLEAMQASDVVVKSPGISRYSPVVAAVEAAGAVVAGGLGLWLQEADRSRVVCVTGTKGKSSTTAITAHLMRGLGHRVLLAGNIGVPPFDPSVERDVDYWVVEVSSYQVTDLGVAPPVVAVTSLSPDHLPWHGGDVERYYADKLSLCTLPGADLTVANGDDDLLRARASLLGPRVEWVGAGDEPGPTSLEPLGLLGRHQRRNALLAKAILVAMGVPGADDDAALAGAAEGFAGLESRLQMVGEVDGVQFVDDSLSTNVLPTLAAVEAFPDRRVALLVGGHDRGIDYRALAAGLKGRVAPLLLLTMPDNGDAIADVVEAEGTGANVEVRRAGDLAEATQAGFEWARPDGVVLLSPAAASFGRFRDYRHRGDVFAEVMRAIADDRGATA